MNPQRIHQCIELMRNADAAHFNMETFQHNASGINNRSIVTTLEELEHSCGNTACFAGYLAVAPFFHKDGGRVDTALGDPEFGPHCSSSAVAAYLDISVELAECIVAGDAPDAALFYQLPYNEVPSSFWRCAVGVEFEDVEPRHVVTVLERLLAGEYGEQTFHEPA